VRRSPRLARALVVLVIAGRARAAAAHDAATSTLEARPASAGVQVVFRLDATSVHDVTGGEQARVLAYLDERFRVSHAGAPCPRDPPRVFTVDAANNDVVIDVVYRCHGVVRFESTLFHDEITPHELIGTFHGAGTADRHFFTRGERVVTMTIDTPPPVQPLHMATPPPGAFRDPPRPTGPSGPSGGTKPSMRQNPVMRKVLGVVIMWSALVAGAAGCAPRSEADPGVLMIEEKEQTASFIRNFNPLLEVGDVRWPATKSMYEPLLIYNTINGEYVPWLATSYAYSDDHRTLRLELRPGVRWSDGAPFTARDVVFTFELLRRFPGLDMRGVWAFVDRIDAVDDDTVEIGFSRVFIPGFYYLAQQPIVPEHIWKDVPDPVSWPNPNPVATGPFTEVTTFQTQVYQVERNPYYWQLPDRPQVEAIRFLAFPSNDQANFALIHGEVDWSGSFVPAIDRIFASRDREHHHYWFPPIDGGVLLYANTTRAPYDDVRVRKALSLAIDRDLIVRVAMYGYAQPATGGDWVRHDAERAAALLDQAGLVRGSDGVRRLRDGSRWQVAIHVPGGFSDWVRATQVIARGLRALGIDAEMKTYDFNAWYEKIQQGDYALSLGWAEPYPSAYGYYRAMMSSETARPNGEPAAENWHRFALPRADQLLHTLEQTADASTIEDLEAELAALFDQNAPAIPLFPGPLWGAYNSERFTGFPDQDHPYAPLSPNLNPQALLVLTQLVPREAGR